LKHIANVDSIFCEIKKVILSNDSGTIVNAPVLLSQLQSDSALLKHEIMLSQEEKNSFVALHIDKLNTSTNNGTETEHESMLHTSQSNGAICYMDCTNSICILAVYLLCLSNIMFL
jgi:hypothetical protein